MKRKLQSEQSEEEESEEEEEKGEEGINQLITNHNEKEKTKEPALKQLKRNIEDQQLNNNTNLFFTFVSSDCLKIILSFLNIQDLEFNLFLSKEWAKHAIPYFLEITKIEYQSKNHFNDLNLRVKNSESYSDDDSDVEFYKTQTHWAECIEYSDDEESDDEQDLRELIPFGIPLSKGSVIKQYELSEADFTPQEYVKLVKSQLNIDTEEDLPQNPYLFTDLIKEEKRQGDIFLNETMEAIRRDTINGFIVKEHLSTTDPLSKDNCKVISKYEMNDNEQIQEQLRNDPEFNFYSLRSGIYKLVKKGGVKYYEPQIVADTVQLLKDYLTPIIREAYDLKFGNKEHVLEFTESKEEYDKYWESEEKNKLKDAIDSDLKLQYKDIEQAIKNVYGKSLLLGDTREIIEEQESMEESEEEDEFEDEEMAAKELLQELQELKDEEDDDFISDEKDEEEDNNEQKLIEESEEEYEEKSEEKEDEEMAAKELLQGLQELKDDVFINDEKEEEDSNELIIIIEGSDEEIEEKEDEVSNDEESDEEDNKYEESEEEEEDDEEKSDEEEEEYDSNEESDEEDDSICSNNDIELSNSVKKHYGLNSNHSPFKDISIIVTVPDEDEYFINDSDLTNLITDNNFTPEQLKDDNLQNQLIKVSIRVHEEIYGKERTHNEKLYLKNWFGYGPLFYSMSASHLGNENPEELLLMEVEEEDKKDEDFTEEEWIEKCRKQDLLYFGYSLYDDEEGEYLEIYNESNKSDEEEQASEEESKEYHLRRLLRQESMKCIEEYFNM